MISILATASLPIAAFNPHQEDECQVCISVHPKAKRRESFRFIQLEEYVSTAEHCYSAPSLISPPETVMLDDIVKIVDSSTAYILLESTTNEVGFYTLFYPRFLLKERTISDLNI